VVWLEVESCAVVRAAHMRRTGEGAGEEVRLPKVVLDLEI
jgi:hypothetical protein